MIAPNRVIMLIPEIPHNTPVIVNIFNKHLTASWCRVFFLRAAPPFAFTSPASSSNKLLSNKWCKSCLSAANITELALNFFFCYYLCGSYFIFFSNNQVTHGNYFSENLAILSQIWIVLVKPNKTQKVTIFLQAIV